MKVQSFQPEVEHLQGNGPYACIYIYPGKRRETGSRLRSRSVYGEEQMCRLFSHSGHKRRVSWRLQELISHFICPFLHRTFSSPAYTPFSVLRPAAGVSAPICSVTDEQSLWQAVLQSLNCGSCEIKANVNLYKCFRISWGKKE